MRPVLPPPVHGLLALLCMWAFSRFLPDLNIEFPGQRAIAGSLIAIGVIIDLVAVRAFGQAKTTINPLKPEASSELVLSGLYRYTRNPMYVGMLCILLGFAIGFGNPLGLLAVAAFVTSITLMQIRPEERALEAMFGDNYRDYRRQVRRWI